MEMQLFRTVRFHAAITAVIAVVVFLCLLVYGGDTPLLLILFLSGAVGGVTNTYLRVRDLPSDVNEADNPIVNILAIIQVYVSLFIAGVFGVLLYAFFLTDMINGSLFPNFTGLKNEYTGTLGLFNNIQPLAQIDGAKAIVWSFVAGFSERLVPNIIDKMAREAESSAPKNKPV